MSDGGEGEGGGAGCRPKNESPTQWCGERNSHIGPPYWATYLRTIIETCESGDCLVSSHVSPLGLPSLNQSWPWNILFLLLWLIAGWYIYFLGKKTIGPLLTQQISSAYPLGALLVGTPISFWFLVDLQTLVLWFINQQTLPYIGNQKNSSDFHSFQRGNAPWQIVPWHGCIGCNVMSSAIGVARRMRNGSEKSG